MENRKFDVAIIGSGPGGYVAAIYLARSGKSVAVIEKDQVGGVCLNKGCIPTKALLASAETLSVVKESASFGIDVASYKVDFNKINARKDEIVKRLRQGIETLFKVRKIFFVNAAAKLAAPDTIDCGKVQIKAKDIIIATGSRPAEIPDFKFDGRGILSSDDILQNKQIPKSLLVVGAGAIGCEFAAIYNSLGCKVALVEKMDEILPYFDREISRRLRQVFKKHGIDVLTAASAESIKKIQAEKTLVCVGRRPNSENLGLEDAGVGLEGGKIVVDEFLRTRVPNIYAVGDVVGRFQLAHVASYQGIIAARNICGEIKRADYTSVPNCVYTSPEIASVGLSGDAVADSGSAKAVSFPFSALGRAHAAGETEGFVKLVGDTKTGRLLGAHIFGPAATDIIAEAALAIKKGMTVEEIADTIHSHPTFPEGLMEAGHIFSGKGIHVV